jgi:hypothetical protein
MNDTEFEHSLRRFRPGPPSAGLRSKIAAELAARGQSAAVAHGLRWRKNLLQKILFGLGSAAAGAAAMYFATLQPQPERLASAGEIDPAAAESPSLAWPEDGIQTGRELLSAEDDGWLVEASSEPQRRLRVRYLERLRWTLPGTGSVVEVEMPREDVVLIPVVMQ